VLLAEGLLLGVRYDSAAWQRFGAGWWTPVVATAGWAMPAAASVLAAIVLVALADARRTNEPAPWCQSQRRAPWIALELGAFVVALALGERLFDASEALPRPGVWIASWLATLALTCAAWLVALAPPRALLRIARRNAAAWLAATALGAFAFGAGRSAWVHDEPLRRATLAAARALLALVEPSAHADASSFMLGARDFDVRVARACSGEEGLALASVFALAALWLFRREWRFSRAWLVVPLTASAAWCANVVRLAALVWLGARVSPTLALGGFHSYAGTVLFCAASLASVRLALRSRWFTRATSAAHETSSAPAAPYLVPFLASVAAGLVSSAFATEAGEPLLPLRVGVEIAALTCFGHTYRRAPWKPSRFALASGLAVALAWLGLARLGATASPGAAGPTFELALRAARAVLLVPALEELAFRGFLARRVGSTDFERVDPRALPWAGVVVSSLAFGVLHHRVAAGVIAGAAYALVYRRRGVLADAVWAHATTNLALVAFAAALGDWNLWR
jgi:exosortase E/protease (VPEID-CTERM system)